MAETQERVIKIVVDATSAKAGRDEVNRALDSIDEKLAKLGDSVTSAFSTVKNVLLGFLSFEAIKTQIDGLITAFDKLGSRASTLGVSTQWLQAFEFAAASSSVKLDAAGSALEKFARIVGEAALGNKAAVDTLDQLNVKIFDAQKQVRPVSDLFSEAAANLSKMSAGGVQSALAIQAMGRDAQRVIPMLDKVGQGSEAMIAAGQKAGSIVSREAVQIWEDLASAADKSMIKWRAFAGENFAETVKTGFDLVTSAISGAVSKLAEFAAALPKVWEQAKGVANSLALQLGERHIADNASARAGVEKKLVDTNDLIRRYEYAYVPGDMMTIGHRDALNERDKLQRHLKYYDDQARGLYATQEEIRKRPAADALARQQYASQLLVSGSFTEENGPTTGAFGGTALDAGQGDRITKRLQLMQAEAEAQAKMAEKAKISAAAVDEEQASFAALKQAIEAFGDGATRTDPKVQALAAQLKVLNEEAKQGQLLTQFRLQTGEIERQNELAAKRLELINAAPEVAARELAVLQVQNEVKKTGVKLSDEDIASRIAAVEKTELLAQRTQEAQRAIELWQAPVKQALQNIQTAAADTWDKILETGNFSFQSLADAFKVTIRRMAAEFLALATIRPVMSLVVSAAGAAGLVSPAQAGQMGFPQSVSGGGGGGMFGGGGLPGGGLGNMFGSGGGGMFGGIGQWLNTPLTGPYAGISPAAMEGVPMLSGAAGAGITPLSALGGIGSIGMGAYGLINGKGGTAGTIGSIGQIAGGIMMMVPGLQPFGAALSLLSSVVPGFFGGGPQIPEMPGLGYQQGTLFYGSGTDAITSGGLASGAGSIGQTVQSLIAASGGTPIAGKLYGGTVSGGSNHTWNGQQWVDSPYTQANLLAPDLSTSSIGGTGQGVSLQAAADALAAAIFRSDVLSGAIEGLGPTLTKVLSENAPTTTAEMSSIIAMSKLYDGFKDPSLATNLTAASKAFDQIKASLADVTTFAQKYGLDVSVVANEQLRQQFDYGTNYLAQFQTPSDPLRAALDNLEKQKAAALKETKYLNDNIGAVPRMSSAAVGNFISAPNLGDSDAIDSFISAIYQDQFGRTPDQPGLEYWRGQIRGGTLSPGLAPAAIVNGALGADRTMTDNINQITESFLKQEAALREQYYGQSLSSLQSLVQRLTFGDLSNGNPASTLSGLGGSYSALLAQVRANPTDTALLGQFGSAASDYLQFGHQFFASGPGFEELRRQILADVLSVESGVVSGNGNDAVVSAEQVKALILVFQQAIASMNDNSEQMAALQAQMADLVDLQQRIATNA